MPDNEQLTHIEDDAVIERAAPGADGSSGRRIDIRLVKWGEVAQNTNEGYRERFVRGAFAKVKADRVTLEAQRHGGPIVGVAESIEERDDGAYGTFRVARTPAGDELLALADEGILRAASVSYLPLPNGTRQVDGLVERTRVDLARVAVLDRGAYPSAAVLAVRSEAEAQEAVVTDAAAQPEPETPAPPMPEPPDPTPAPKPQEEPVPTPALVERSAPFDASPIIERLTGIESRMGAIETMGAMTPAAPEVPMLYELKSFGEFVERAHAEAAVVPGGRPADDGIRYAMAEFLHRALSDQITGNNLGIIPPAFLLSVKRIVDYGRPVIQALGGPQPLPATGMEVDWPYVSSSNVIIGEQLTQKAEVTSARVDIAKDSSAIKTYAGASDISLQLLRRSGPGYREAYDRIMLAYWAKVTDAAFAAALLTAGTAATYGWDADTTGQNLKEAIFAASVQVETATGLPASVVLCATDVFQQLARLPQIVPASPPGNPSNASGTLDAGTLRVNVAGLPLIHARGLTTGNVLVTNEAAAQWLEDGPFSAVSDDIAHLGQDVAWYSFGVAATYVPAGIVKLFGPGASGS